MTYYVVGWAPLQMGCDCNKLAHYTIVGVWSVMVYFCACYAFLFSAGILFYHWQSYGDASKLFDRDVYALIFWMM